MWECKGLKANALTGYTESLVNPKLITKLSDPHHLPSPVECEMRSIIANIKKVSSCNQLEVLISFYHNFMG